MRLADPLFLILLLPLAAILFWQVRRRDGGATLRFSDARMFQGAGWRAWVTRVVPALAYAAVTLLILALARPQTGASRSEVKSEGIDIVLCIDVSGSMRAEDMGPGNRLAVVKEVAKKLHCKVIELYESFGWDLYDRYEHALLAFKKIMR